MIDSWSYEPIFFNGYYQTYNQCEYYIVESGARWIWGTVVAIIVCGGWIYNYLCNQCYHHWCCEFESGSGSGWCVQHYVITYVSDLQQFGGFLRFPPPSQHNWNICLNQPNLPDSGYLLKMHVFHSCNVMVFSVLAE